MNELTHTALGVVAGGLITIAVAITVEWLRLPWLTIDLLPPKDIVYNPPRHAGRMRILNVRVTNHHLAQWLQWMARAPGSLGIGEVTFYHLDGQRVFSSAKTPRWEGAPEPAATIAIRSGDSIVSVYSPMGNAMQRIDIPAGDFADLNVVARFDNDTHCFAWGNDNYFTEPPWRSPEWAIPSDRYLVRVKVRFGEISKERVFRLVNSGSIQEFRLDESVADDVKTIRKHEQVSGTASL